MVLSALLVASGCGGSGGKKQALHHDSCGKCVPCREGTRWVVQILRPIEAGQAQQGEVDFLLDVCDRINSKCVCPLGDSDTIAVASYVTRFRDEF
jgi:NADH-quinone oxidoreductase subunit F